MGLGSQSVIGLAEARQIALEQKRLVTLGADPIEQRKQIQKSKSILLIFLSLQFPLLNHLFHSFFQIHRYMRAINLIICLWPSCHIKPFFVRFIHNTYVLFIRSSAICAIIAPVVAPFAMGYNQPCRDAPYKLTNADAPH